MGNKAYIVTGLVFGVLAAIGHSHQNGSDQNGSDQAAAAAPISATNNPASRCLSAWDGSSYEFNTQIKAVLRDPDSFQHIETVYDIHTLNTGHTIIMTKYRAKNGFGGYNISIASGDLNLNTCRTIFVGTADQ